MLILKLLRKRKLLYIQKYQVGVSVCGISLYKLSKIWIFLSFERSIKNSVFWKSCKIIPLTLKNVLTYYSCVTKSVNHICHYNSSSSGNLHYFSKYFDWYHRCDTAQDFAKTSIFYPMTLTHTFFCLLANHVPATS